MLQLKDERLINTLMALPESDEGYHIVDIALKNGKEIKEVLVRNAELVYLPYIYKTVVEEDIVSIKMSDMSA